MTPIAEPRRARRALVLGTIGSIVAHALFAIVLMDVTNAPSFDFDLELPDTIELGLTDELEAYQGGREAPEPEPEASAGVAAGDGFADAGVPDAGIADAGVDAGRRRDAGVDAGPAVASAEGDGEGTGAGEGTSRIPAGAQLAVRIDLATVRASPLADDVRRFLMAIPDWQLILEGSGLDPLDDLDRLLIASPNLQRAQMVMAGRHAHASEGEDGSGYVREVVARFGAARGAATPWRTEHGLPVAPWPNEDVTARVVALVGPRHFVLCRPEDLQRVLSIARAREERAQGDDDLEDASGPEALLAMGAGEALSFEAEGARRFVRGGDPTLFPASLRAAARPIDDGRVNLRASARFEDEDEAQRALEYWGDQRERLAEQTMIRLLGFASLLRSTRLEREGRTLEVDATLTASQMRAILGFLEGAIRRPRRGATPGPTPGPATMAPAGPATMAPAAEGSGSAGAGSGSAGAGSGSTASPAPAEP